MNAIPLSQIRPNDWNPNKMTQEESAELVAELKHLGRVPKPVVLRQNGGDYEIIDGEQTYKAMLELGWTELQPGWYEVAEFDDFEAMRQTYKRNQHGTHHKVKEGQLFVRMIAERGLSQSALAREMEVSEGTVRNALEYVKALEPRNGYEAEDLEPIAGLTVRQVRQLNALEVELGDAWMRGGAKPDDWPKGYYVDPALVKLLPILRPRGLRNALEALHRINAACQLWSFAHSRLNSKTDKRSRVYLGGYRLDPEEAAPYCELWLRRSRWKAKSGAIAESLDLNTRWMQDMLEAISRPDGRRAAKVILPLERVSAWLEYPEGMLLTDFCKALERETTAIAGEPTEMYELWRTQVEAYAPANIRDASLHISDKYGLWQVSKLAVDEGWGTELVGSLVANILASASAYEEGASSQGLARIFEKQLEVLTAKLNQEDTLRSFGDKEAMLELVFDRMKLLAAVWGLSEKGQHKGEVVKAFAPMIERLAAVPEPELALLCAMLLHRDDYWEIWARALGWKFDAAPKETGEPSAKSDSHTRSEEVSP